MAGVKDIAAMAGVSPSTVSIVVNGKSDERSISEATRARVWEAARKLDYKPNIAARRLRNRQEETAVIAVFWTTDFRASMMVRFLNGLHRSLSTADQKLELLIVPYRNDSLHEALSRRNENFFNAAIICNASQADMDFLERTSFHIPIVLYNRHSTCYDTVNIDDALLGRMAADVFLSRGHHTAGILTSPAVFKGMQMRVDSFSTRCTDGGMCVLAVQPCAHSMHGGFDAATTLMQTHPEIDCLFCASDSIAIGALKALQDIGVPIPGQMELISIGNGDLEMEEFARVPLSVVHIPMEEMAEACLKLVTERLGDFSDASPMPRRSVGMTLEYRARVSCGPVP